MSNIRYERHFMSNPSLPFIFHTDTIHTTQTASANWHDNTEFLYCIEGSGIVNCDHMKIPMNVGDTIVINARKLHDVTAKKHVKYHCFIFDNSFFTENGINIQDIKFNEKISDAHAGHLMKKIAESIMDTDNSLHITAVRLCVLEFLYYVTKNFSAKNTSLSPVASKSYTAVLDAVEYINNNYSMKLPLDDLAARVGFSRYHFSRIFKENTGVTVVEHINARRCDSAAFLLRETHKPISEIAAECGFESPSYFAKSFSEAYGILPSDYRKKYSKK